MANGGKFEIRPAGAAPLFDSDSGKAAARKRWDAERENTEREIVAFAEEELGREVTLDDAVSFVVNLPQFKKSLEGHTAAAKFVSQKLDILPVSGSNQTPQLLQDNRSVNVYNFDSKHRVLEFAETLDQAGDKETADSVRDQLIGDGPYEIKIET